MTDAPPHQPETIDYCGEQIVCPVSAHPRLREIRVLLANGENHESIAEQFGIPGAHVEGRETEHNRGPEAGEFVRRYKSRHPEIFHGSRPTI